jgi:hypothetical protein
MSASRPRPDRHGELQIHGQARRACGRLSAGLWEGIPARSTAVLSLRGRGRAFVVGVLVGAGCCCDRDTRCWAGQRRTGWEAGGL